MVDAPQRQVFRVSSYLMAWASGCASLVYVEAGNMFKLVCGKKGSARQI